MNNLQAVKDTENYLKFVILNLSDYLMHCLFFILTFGDGRNFTNLNNMQLRLF